MAPAHPLEALRSIGWQGDLPSRPVARVIAQHRAGYELHDGRQVLPAQPAAAFLRPGLQPAERPAVGDFVELGGGQPVTIETIVPRRSVLSRAAAGERYKQQLIATNIDTVMVLTGLDADYNPARIERYLTLIACSGVAPVVLLSKADKVDDAAARASELQQRLGEGTPVRAINAKAPGTIAELGSWLQPGMTVALVGSSGAGKSTLTNTLLGEQRMATAAVRRRDSRGRHTTVHRALLKLPGGACLIDTPGMRELKLTGQEPLDAFEDVEALALRCRFNDCGHCGEPGCAVRAAIEAGALDAARLHNYLKLAQEQRQQEQLRQQREQRQQGRRRERSRGREPR